MGFTIPVMPYSARWKTYRRLISRHLNPSGGAQPFPGWQSKATHKLLRLLLSDPNNLKQNLINTTASLLIGLAYGYEVQAGNNHVVEIARRVAKETTKGFQPTYLVNIFPVRK